MTLQAKIDALPRYPTPPIDGLRYCDPLLLGAYRHAERTALSARLALCREWIENNGHAWNCDMRLQVKSVVCDCGRDALLQAIEGPKP